MSDREALHETHVCRDCGASITIPYAKPDGAGDAMVAVLAQRLRDVWTTSDTDPDPEADARTILGERGEFYPDGAATDGLLNATGGNLVATPPAPSRPGWAYLSDHPSTAQTEGRSHVMYASEWHPPEAPASDSLDVGRLELAIERASDGIPETDDGGYSDLPTASAVAREYAALAAAPRSETPQDFGEQLLTREPKP